MIKAILPNPMVEIMGVKTSAFERMYKRINQLEGLLSLLHFAHDDTDRSNLDYTLELATNMAVEIRELAALIDDSAPPHDDAAAMRQSYREAAEAAEALMTVLTPNWVSDAVTDAADMLEANISAAREDFIGAKEVDHG